MENIVTNNMPILFKKDAMEAIWARRFIRFHGIEGCCYFSFGDGSSEGVFGTFIDDGVRTKGEVAVLVMVVGAKEVFEKSLGFFLEDGGVSGPGTIREFESMDSILFPSDDGLGMEE